MVLYRVSRGVLLVIANTSLAAALVIAAGSAHIGPCFIRCKWGHEISGAQSFEFITLLLLTSAVAFDLLMFRPIGVMLIGLGALCLSLTPAGLVGFMLAVSYTFAAPYLFAGWCLFAAISLACRVPRDDAFALGLAILLVLIGPQIGIRLAIMQRAALIGPSHCLVQSGKIVESSWSLDFGGIINAQTPRVQLITPSGDYNYVWRFRKFQLSALKSATPAGRRHSLLQSASAGINSNECGRHPILAAACRKPSRMGA